ncbi:MAG TPA: MBL fold metallo-hydrolase [Anaerolineales bacterium]|nr:MBL fold metallo-hydrolase [Anaerolineales bacterium]
MKKIFRFSLFVLVGFIVLVILFLGIQQAFVNAQVEREWQVVPTSIPDLEATTRLEIIPLYEEDRINESLDYGHGVSYLVRTDSATILMDLGNNPAESAQLPSLKNMQVLGIAWEEIDAIVISHPHPDHVGGIAAWQNKTFSFGDFSGDLSQMPIYVPIAMTYPGGKIIHSAQPSVISKDIATTGVISYPEVFPIFLFTPKGNEQGLVINVAGQGLVMITGCGHPTMERLVTRVETLFDEQVVGVVGGLHYEGASAEEVTPHIQFLETRQPQFVALSPHDSSPEALEAFQLTFPAAYQFIRVGEAIQFP